MLKLIGYADRFSVAPGETVRFMVSALEDQPYQAEIIRLIHGDANPEGPGFKSERVPSGVEAAYVGRRQAISAGSWARVPFHPRLKDLRSFTVAAMIWPTTPCRRPPHRSSPRSASRWRRCAAARASGATTTAASTARA